MAVDDSERRLLLAQMQQDRDQRHMLDDIGEIAGVVGMAIIHFEIVSSASPLVRGPNRPMTMATIAMQPAMNTNTPGAPASCRIKAMTKALNMVASRLKE